MPGSKNLPITFLSKLYARKNCAYRQGISTLRLYAEALSVDLAKMLIFCFINWRLLVFKGLGPRRRRGWAALRSARSSGHGERATCASRCPPLPHGGISAAHTGLTAGALAHRGGVRTLRPRSRGARSDPTRPDPIRASVCAPRADTAPALLPPNYVIT